MMLAASSFGDGFHQQVTLAPVLVMGKCLEHSGENSNALLMKTEMFTLEGEPYSKWLSLLQDIKGQHFPNNCLSMSYLNGFRSK